MNFNTALFLFIFFPFFLIAYFIAQPRWRPWIGLGASVIFYAWGELISLVWIAGLVLVNYFVGINTGGKWKTKLIPIGLIFNVGMFVFFKLFNSYGFDMFLGLGPSLQARTPDWFDLSLQFPLGLSFISFQAISYLLDVNKGTVKPEKNLLSFAFYILMFPKLLVGPIVRYRTISEQLPAPIIDRDQITGGIRRFLQGFIKKMLISDILAKTVNAAFDMPIDGLSTQFAWLGLIGYALQIFFDFSGYTDMAIGLASMMGFRFIENFNYPYIAESIGDFWRRWHISLSTWFRDYVFFPLERRRLPFAGQSINILIVFLLTGLWHDLSFKFVVWGLMHGTFIALENLFLARWLTKVPRLFRHLYALAAILLTWLVFRSPSLDYAWEFLRVLAGLVGEPAALPFSETSPLPFIEPSFILAILFGLLFSLPIAPSIQKYTKDSMLATIVGDILLIMLFVVALGVMTSSTFLPGIYANF